jgi:hypothetical protein
MMMTTMALHPWEIEIELRKIKAKKMLVLTKVGHSARRRIPVILGFVKIWVENWGQLR